MIEKEVPDVGERIYDLASYLFPICRSITGDGVRETLRIVRSYVPGLQLHEVPTGTKVFDWVVPREWNIVDGYIIDPNGVKIVDFQENNLHVVGYSIPVDDVFSLEELQKKLYSRPDRPNSIPYVTSYYKEDWGFCLSDNLRQNLSPGNYRVRIDSSLTNGSMTYGELLLPGKLDTEIFFSTYICHPSMANNEISGPSLLAILIESLQGLDLNYTYRFVFVPETIGSIAYIKSNIETLKSKVIAGFNVTCVGDDRCYSYLPSRQGHTLADQVAKHVLEKLVGNYIEYSFLDRGSDERQYCAPGVDLPFCSIMRSKYGVYDEYHTSDDDLSFISPEGFQGAFNVIYKCIQTLEWNELLETKITCEPQLGRRDLYSSLGARGGNTQGRLIANILAYSDGCTSLLDIAELLSMPIWDLKDTINIMLEHELLSTYPLNQE